MKNKMLRILLVVLSLLTILSFASCAASKNEVGNFAPEAEAPNVGLGDDLLADPAKGQETVRKIIKTYDLNAETKDFDATVSAIDALVAEHGGYVENNSINYRHYGNSQSARYASYRFRIPAENADAFVNSVGNTLNVTRNSSYAEDVSETYYSIEATLEELTAERDSLLAMMKSLDSQKDYNFWLTLQTRLSEVRQQIARLQAQLNNYDSRVSYSTVNLSINEVVTYTPVEESFGAKIAAAFSKGWTAFGEFMEGLVIVLVTIFPFLLIPAAAGIVTIVLIRRKGGKKNAKKVEENQETKTE